MEYLEKYNKMKFAIQECHKIDEIKLIRDKAEAYRYVMIQAKESPGLIRKAEEIKLRAERRAGELLPEQIRKSEEGRPKEAFQGRTLTNMNIERKQSSNWQRIASIPEDKFEEYINTEKEITTSGAVKLAKKTQRRKEIEKQKQDIEEGKIELPQGKYEVIVIDPPWPYNSKYDPDTFRGATPYPEMTIEDLHKIDLPATDNCILFLWTTHKFIWEAKELLNIWGFEYRSIIVWDKNKMGIGRLFRLQCEFCLVGLKGTPILSNNNTHRDIITESRREHSRKPEAFYIMVNELCVGRKLDYFSREKRKGWGMLGKEEFNGTI